MEKQIQGCSISCLLIIAQTQQLEIFMTALTGCIFSNNLYKFFAHINHRILKQN